MKISVKYHLFEDNQQPIKSIALQKEYLAMSSGTEENWLQLHKVLHDSTSADPIKFQRANHPSLNQRLISLLSWSPLGNFLASASVTLTIWEFQSGNKQNTLIKYHEYSDHGLEITAIAWSPDGSKVATCSLDSKVIITDIKQKQRIKQIDCGNKAVGISWDPLDRYVGCLRFDNNVVLWKTTTWEQSVQVCLNFTATQSEKYTSKREDRKIDWSPDCRYLLVPSMDDRVVPVVCALDRHQDFKIAKTFIGPFSSVNSVRFSPVLYQQDGIKSVFAMGDNDGNISFWHLNSKFPEKPIFLLKNTSGELIEDIAWSRDGSVMMATTMRRYIIIVVFDDEETLGVPLSAEAHTRHLDEVYGGAKQQVVTSNSKFTSIRTYNSYDQPAAQIQQEKPIVAEPEMPKVFTQQSVTIVNGKKKIIPKIQVVQQPPAPVPVVAPIELLPQTPPPPLTKTIPIMLQQPQALPFQFTHYLQNDSCLVFEQLRGANFLAKPSTLIKCLRSRDKQDVRWVDQVEGQVIHLQSNAHYICIYTSHSFLYVSNLIGKRQFPPAIIPGVCKMHMNAHSDLLLVQEMGDFKLLSLAEQRVLIEGDLKNLLRNETNNDPILQAFLAKDIDGQIVPHLLLRDSTLYYYSQQLNEWVRSRKVEINSNIDEERITQQVNKPPKNDSFFSRLVIDDTYFQRNEALSDIQQIAQYEEHISQMIKYSDGVGFCNVVYAYIRRLCDNLPVNGEKLHDILMRMVVRNNSEEYSYLQRTNVAPSDVKQNVLYILQQYPKAFEYRQLIE